MRESNALTVTPRPVSSWDTPEGIATIKQTVAKGASDQQLAMFLEVARSTGLNPFLREIWFIAQTGTIMAGRDGYLSVANRHPMFDGMESHIMEYDPKTRQPVKAECRVWRKDRSHPTVCEAWFHEYYKPNSQVWRQYPSAMLIKVAEVMALKRTFAINGVVTEEELAERPYDRNFPPVQDNPAFQPGPSDEQRAQLDALLETRGIDGQERIRIHAEATQLSGPEEFELWFEKLADRIAQQAEAEAAEIVPPEPQPATDGPTAEQWQRFDELVNQYYSSARKRQEAHDKFRTFNETAAEIALVQLRQKLATRSGKSAARRGDNRWEQVEYIESRLKLLCDDLQSPQAAEIIRNLTRGHFDSWQLLREQADPATLSDVATRVQRMAS